MQRILASLLVAISWTGVARAQEMSGNKAEEVKKDIITLEEEKAEIVLKGGTIAADYYDRFYDDGVYLSSGKGVRTKTEIVPDWRSGVQKILSTKHYDFRVHVYDNGNTAVFAPRASGTMQIRATPSIDHAEKALEVFVKHSEKWRVVAHGVVDVKNRSLQQVAREHCRRSLLSKSAFLEDTQLSRPAVGKLEHGHISV